MDLRETEKPKSSGNSAKSFFNSVLLPTPEGPERTMGRLSLGMGGVEAQLVVDMLANDLERMEDDGSRDGGATDRKVEIKRFIRMRAQSCCPSDRSM